MNSRLYKRSSTTVFLEKSRSTDKREGFTIIHISMIYLVRQYVAQRVLCDRGSAII